MGRPTLLDEIQWETRAVDDGISRYRRMRRLRPAETPPAFAFLLKRLDRLTNTIALDQQQLANRQSGRPPVRKELFQSLPAEKLALITLSTALTAVLTRGSDATITSIARQIAELCRLELHFMSLPKARRKTTPHWERRKVIGWRSRCVREDRLVEWKFAVKEVNIGEHLIRFLLDSTTGFEVRSRPAPVGRKHWERAATLTLTKEADDWFKQAHTNAEGLMPVNLPMIVVPETWEGLDGGGYVTNRRTAALPLVKRLEDIGIDELRNVDLARVYRAVNALQKTAWAVNTAIYTLMRDAWNDRLEVGKLPIKAPEAPQQHPRDVPEHARKNLSLKWRRWYGKRDGIVGSATMLRMRLKYCHLLKNAKKYPGLYLPYQLDRRGRAYPVPQLFHPQADDIGRSLIRFARGKPLNDRAREWLTIHLATLYGKPVNKKSFRERIAWVDEHEKQIRDSVKNPFKGEPLWCTAESPWRFLAACQEWTNPSKERGRFVSYLPINVDGTCNGFQHLSALSGDLTGAQATNLIPSATPQDIYQNVLDLLRSRLRELAQGGNSMALAWLPRLDDRKVVKRATMATPYGIKHGGIKDALIDEELTEGFEDEVKAAYYLVEHIKWAIETAAPRSQNILEWLRDKIAKELKKHGLPVIWTTPAGFRVVHYYPARKKRSVRAGGFSLQVKMEPTKDFEDEQISAIGANFVHSLDAAHMMLTVKRLVDEDAERFKDFAMAHDSYGVHACDVDDMNRVLREEFVKMHSHQLLEKFVEEQRQRSGLKLDGPKLTGDGFDLNAVLRSEYFFS